MMGDLHCHTNFSDGSINIDDAVTYAKSKGLSHLAITDHDTMEGVPKAVMLGNRIGITVIPGTEISCMDKDSGRKVHLLCYLPVCPEKLEPMLTKISESRRDSNLESLRLIQQYHPVTERMVEKYCGEINRLHKCHIMNALLDLGLDSQIYGELYRFHFSKGSPQFCRAHIEYASIYDALKIVRSAGGISVIAHPGEDGGLLILENAAKSGLLDGVELNHPSNKPQHRKFISEMAEKYNLITTGGTDFHGYYSTPAKIYPLGSFTTDDENINRIYALYEKRKQQAV